MKTEAARKIALLESDLMSVNGMASRPFGILSGLATVSLGDGFSMTTEELLGEEQEAQAIDPVNFLNDSSFL
jgi:hypothetical protein